MSEIKKDKFDLLRNAGKQQIPEATEAATLKNGIVSDIEAPPETTEVLPIFQSWTEQRQHIASVSWFWRGWIPNGLPSMVVAKPGQGKSTFVLWLCGLITGSVKSFPDGTPYEGEKGKIFWIETESGSAMNLDRVEKFGFPHDAFISLPLGQSVDLDNSATRDQIEAIASLPDVKLIVLDSFSMAHTRKENDAEVRVFGNWIASVAQKTNKPFIVIHHMNKLATGLDVPTQANVRGSSAIVQFPRSIIAIDTPDVTIKAKRLTVIKTNVGMIPPPLEFEIESDELLFSEYAGSEPKPKDKLTIATLFLNEELKAGKRKQDEILAKAVGQGIADKTLRRAKSTLGVISEQHWNNETGQKYWSWRLPERKTAEKSAENDEKMPF